MYCYSVFAAPEYLCDVKREHQCKKCDPCDILQEAHGGHKKIIPVLHVLRG